jgi:hypothetical protein
VAALEPFAAALRAGQRARTVARDHDDEPLLRDLALLSERPVLFVLNTGDEGGEPGSRPNSPNSTPTRRRYFAPSWGAPSPNSMLSSPPHTAFSVTSAFTPATTAAARPVPGSCHAVRTPNRLPAASTATS